MTDTALAQPTARLVPAAPVRTVIRIVYMPRDQLAAGGGPGITGGEPQVDVGEWLGDPETARQAWVDFRAGDRVTGSVSDVTSWRRDSTVPVP